MIICTLNWNRFLVLWTSKETYNTNIYSTSFRSNRFLFRGIRTLMIIALTWSTIIDKNCGSIIEHLNDQKIVLDGAIVLTVNSFNCDDNVEVVWGWKLIVFVRFCKVPRLTLLSLCTQTKFFSTHQMCVHGML